MALAPLYLWLILINIMCVTPYTYGPRSFVCLLGSVLILWRLIPSPSPSINRIIGNSLPLTRRSSQVLISLFALSAITAIGSMIIGVTYGMFHPNDWLIDIAENTFTATQFFANGENPYTSNSQLLVTHFTNQMPHVEVKDGQITMFGIPYYNGYPYFPLMMLSYLPMYAIFEGFAAIRVTHIILIILNILAFKLLLDQLLTNRQLRQTAMFVAVTAYLGIIRYTLEAVAFGVTDMLIATYVMFCFVALTHQRYLLAGLLLGCAQACKLLPAPFILLAILWMLYGHKTVWHFLAGYIIACTVIILPFLLWHPEGFISATILYYLTHHKGGDFTSLWFFLPELVQPIFLIIGILLTIATIFTFSRRGHIDLVSCMAGSYASYAIFMAFSKMTHLNYLWAVLPMGCIALTLAILERNKTEDQAKPHN